MTRDEAKVTQGRESAHFENIGLWLNTSRWWLAFRYGIAQSSAWGISRAVLGSQSTEKYETMVSSLALLHT